VSSPAVFGCQIQDRMCGCGGVLCRMPGNMDVEGHDNERTVCRIKCEAKCRETRMNYIKTYLGVPLKHASVSGKS